MRLINADPIQNGIADYLATNAYLNDTAQDALEMVGKWVNEAPTVEAELVVHAEWEPHPMVPGFVRCSACRDCITYDEWPDGHKWKRCPECGAHMDKEERRATD